MGKSCDGCWESKMGGREKRLGGISLKGKGLVRVLEETPKNLPRQIQMTNQKEILSLPKTEILPR